MSNMETNNTDWDVVAKLMSRFTDINGCTTIAEGLASTSEAWGLVNMTHGITVDESERFINVIKPTKLSKALGSEYAWALYIRSGANKEGSFEDYLKHNKSVKSWEWEMLNRTFKTK